MNKILYLVFTFIILLVFAGSAQALDCCVPPFIQNGFVHAGFTNPLGGDELIDEPADCLQIPPGDSLYQQDCYDANSQVKPELIQTACCCDLQSGRAIDFNKQLTTAQLSSIATIYCGYYNYWPTDLGIDANCILACEIEDPDPDPDVQDYYLVTGYVYAEVDGVRTPFQGAVVASLTPYNSVYADINGFFDLGETPGAASGANLFEATAPAGSELICDKDTIEIILVEATEIEFVLNCWQNTEVCTPEWVYSEWSTNCYPINGVYYQTRTAENLNDCESTEGLELLRRTEDEYGNAVCENINPPIGDCNDGELIPGSNEQCDGDQFIIPGTANIHDASSSGLPLCTDWFGSSFSSGTIGCTPHCSYDYSNCANTCDPTRCRHISQCGECEACIGNTAICGTGCTDSKPIFVPAWLDDTRLSTSRDVFDLYEASLAKGATIIDGVRYEEGTDDVTVSWQFDQGCLGEIYGFRVELCEEDGTTNTCAFGSRRSFVNILPQQTSYTIEGLQPQTNYCYNVCALQTDGTSSCTVDEGSSLPCFATGEEICMTPGHEPGLNCVFDPGPAPGLGKAIPRGCNARDFGQGRLLTNLQLSDLEQARNDCPEGKICVETPYLISENLRGAECRDAEPCGLCNGLLGVYGNTGIILPEFDCEEDQYNYQSQATHVPEPENKYGFCYKDDTKTPFLQFKTCDKVQSCYDYMSQGACENDPCFRFITSNDTEYTLGCAWEPYLTPTISGNQQPETGVGVCRPTEEEIQDCTRCDNRSPVGFCDEQLCDLYGECYYKENVTHYNIKAPLEAFYFEPRDNPQNRRDHLPSCLPKKEMSCFLYETQEDCEGGSSISLNVIYNTDGKRIFGDNSKITTSSDKYDYGVCVWNSAWAGEFEKNEGHGCNKDSDASHLAPIPVYIDECRINNLARQECYQDNEPPVTQLFLREPNPQFGLPTYGQKEIINLEYGKQDNIWDPGDIRTYISLLPLSGTCAQNGCNPTTVAQLSPAQQSTKAQECIDLDCELYPQEIIENFNVGDVQSGDYLFMFYSEDKAKNLEELKTIRIHIDIVGPTININEPTITTRRVAEDIYESDVEITFTTSEEALCNATLTWDMDPSKRFNTGDFIQSGTSFDTIYFALRDGNYELEVNCEDEYHNAASQTLQITVNGDKSIFNPQPKSGDLHATSDGVIMSVETNSSATCRFSPQQEPYSSMPPENTFTSTNGGTMHTFNFDDYQHGTGSNQYNFYVACQFANGDVTEQQDGDLISFTVDRTPPVTTVYHQIGGAWEVFTGAEDYVQERSFKIECTDANDLTPTQNYGCDEISYCLGPMTNLNSFNPSIHCRDGSFTTINENSWSTEGESVYTEASYSIPDDARMYLFYQSTDKNGHKGTLKSLNIKLISTDFTTPLIEVSRLEE